MRIITNKGNNLYDYKIIQILVKIDRIYNLYTIMSRILNLKRKDINRAKIYMINKRC